MGMATISG